MWGGAYLNIAHEFIIAVQVDRAELAHFVELEGDDGRVGPRVVAPADPGGVLGGLSDLVAAELAVDELAQTPAQLLAPLPVVHHVRELNTVASLVTLRHRVRDNSHCNREYCLLLMLLLSRREALVRTGQYHRIVSTSQYPLHIKYPYSLHLVNVSFTALLYLLHWDLSHSLTKCFMLEIICIFS